RADNALRSALVLDADRGAVDPDQLALLFEGPKLQLAPGQLFRTALERALDAVPVVRVHQAHEPGKRAFEVFLPDSMDRVERIGPGNPIGRGVPFPDADFSGAGRQTQPLVLFAQQRLRILARG